MSRTKYSSNPNKLGRRGGSGSKVYQEYLSPVYLANVCLANAKSEKGSEVEPPEHE
jgi:hypothetical protein